MPNHGATICPPGVEPKPGSLLLVNRKAITSSLIRVGQHFRFPKEYAFWSHTAMKLHDGYLAEALIKGVSAAPWDKYKNYPHAWVDIPMCEEERDNVLKFAQHSVGKEYGVWEDVSLAAWLTSGTMWRTTRNNQLICSAYCAEALCRTGAIFPEEPLWNTPAHLAQYYDIKWPLELN